MSSQPKDCGWVGRLPEFEAPQQCQACQLMRSAGEVVRCRMKGPAPPVEAKPPQVRAEPKPVVSAAPVKSSGIGDCLKAYFDSIGAKQSAGCSCKDVQAKLNKRSPEQVQKELDNWAGDILENVKNLTGVTGLVAGAVKYLAPGMLREKLKMEILRCLEESKAKLSQIDQDASKIDPDENMTQ